MRVLLDENIPRTLKECFPDGIDVRTVPECGWAGMKNGTLLRMAAEEFDVFISMDAGISFQQNVRDIPIGIVLLSAPSNRYQDLLPLMPRVTGALAHTRPGDIYRIP